jgi:hypothetical protein
MDFTYLILREGVVITYFKILYDITKDIKLEFSKLALYNSWIYINYTQAKQKLVTN